MPITPLLGEVMHAYNPRAGGQTQGSWGARWPVNLAKTSELQVE